MNETVDNPMLKPSPAPGHEEWPYQAPTAPTFKEYLMEEFSMEDVLGDPQVLEVLITKYHEYYLQWLSVENLIEEIR